MLRRCYSVPDIGAEYCDDRVCLSLCLSVHEHISGTTEPISAPNLFSQVIGLPVAVARASFGGVATRYVFPVS